MPDSPVGSVRTEEIRGADVLDGPLCTCGEWRLTPEEIAQGWHVVADHDPDCDGCCLNCPVAAQCGPIRTLAERDAAKEADVDAPF